MGLKSIGGFRIGGVEWIHPLTSEEIKYILTILINLNFKGNELENLAIITMKLQKEYKQVLEKEEKTN